MRRLRWAAGLMLVAVVAVVAPAAPALATTTWFRAGAFQVATTQGAQGDFTIKQPFLATNDFHSLISIRLLSGVGHSIEVGSTVHRSLNGDAKPHLFVGRTVGFGGQCVNVCGWVQNNVSLHPGSELFVDFAYFMKMQHAQGRWTLFVNSVAIGYFPDSVWNGAFTQTQSVEYVGEVKANGSIPCTYMGSGDYPGSPNAASIASIGYVSGPAVNLATWEDNHSYYQVGVFNTNTVQLGGLGACNSPI